MLKEWDSELKESDVCIKGNWKQELLHNFIQNHDENLFEITENDESDEHVIIEESLWTLLFRTIILEMAFEDSYFSMEQSSITSIFRGKTNN